VFPAINFDCKQQMNSPGLAWLKFPSLFSLTKWDFVDWKTFLADDDNDEFPFRVLFASIKKQGNK